MKKILLLFVPLLLMADWATSPTDGGGGGGAITVAASNSPAWAKSMADYIIGPDTLQSIIDALPDSNWNMCLMVGDYLDSIELRDKYYVWIFGCGSGTKFKTPDSTATTPIRVVGGSGIRITDLFVDGNMYSFCDTVAGTPDTVHFDTTAGEWTLSCIACSTSNNLHVARVECRNAVYMGIQVWRCSTYTIRDGIFSHNRIKGVSTIWGNNGLITDNTIDSNGIEMLDTSVVATRGVGHDGICLHYLEYQTDVINNTVRWNQRSGLNVASVQGAIRGNGLHYTINGPGAYVSQVGQVVDGNTCIGNSSYGIYIYSNAKGCVISDNVCYRNRFEGIQVGTDGNIVTGNQCYNNAKKGLSNLYHGIEISNAKHNYITGNYCWDDSAVVNQCWGIAESGTSDSNTIVNNYCWSNDSGAVRTVGDATYAYLNQDQSNILFFPRMSLILTDTSGQDTLEFIITPGYSYVNSDHPLYFRYNGGNEFDLRSGGLGVYHNIFGDKDGPYSIFWDGEKICVDYDHDDDSCGVYFHGLDDYLRYIPATDRFELSSNLEFVNDTVFHIYAVGADTDTVYTTINSDGEYEVGPPAPTKIDTCLILMSSAMSDVPAGYAQMFVDTVGIDSVIFILDDETRRGYPIE